MKWTEFYDSLASRALKVDIVENCSMWAVYLKANMVPGHSLVTEDWYDTPETLRVPFIDCRLNPNFDLDKMFFNALDAACPSNKFDMRKNHIIVNNGLVEVEIPLYFNVMAEMMNFHGLAPARIFVSDDIGREIVHAINDRDTRYEEITLVDDTDVRLLGKWRQCSILRTNKIDPNLMYMTTFADFLGNIPIHTDAQGPPELGMAIFQPLGIAKAVL